MSHGDHVTTVPAGFHVTAVTDDALNAIEDRSRGIFGVQFHPEVAHTPLGAQVLRNFFFCLRMSGDWSPAAVIQEQIARIREKLVTEGRVVSGLSGGVDSTVASALVHRAVGEQADLHFCRQWLVAGRGVRVDSGSAASRSMNLNIRRCPCRTCVSECAERSSRIRKKSGNGLARSSSMFLSGKQIDWVMSPIWFRELSIRT